MENIGNLSRILKRNSLNPVMTCASPFTTALQNLHSISQSALVKVKLSFFRTQVNVWKKVLGRNISHIKFSHAGTPRPLNDIAKEIFDYIDQNPSEYLPFIKNPGKLVGRQVNHRITKSIISMVHWYSFGL